MTTKPVPRIRQLRRNRGVNERSLDCSKVITVRSLLVGWANDQDAWIRHLVSGVVLSGKPLTDVQLDAIYQTFLREKALSAGTPVDVPKLSDDASSSEASSALLLTKLSELKNVNALASGQAIDLNPKLTIQDTPGCE